MPARTKMARESKKVVDGKKVTVYDEVEKTSRKISLPVFMLVERC